eukprot:jgi/Mesvir1/7774/Mv11717-RA.1
MDFFGEFFAGLKRLQSPSDFTDDMKFIMQSNWFTYLFIAIFPAIAMAVKKSVPEIEKRAKDMTVYRWKVYGAPLFIAFAFALLDTAMKTKFQNMTLALSNLIFLTGVMYTTHVIAMKY